MNINDFDRLYRSTQKGQGLTGQVVRIQLQAVKAGKIRVITHVAVENKTSAFDKCRLGIHSTGRDHYVDEITNIAADELCVSRSDVLMGERDVFFADFTGTTTGDQLIMTALGWTQTLRKP